jgi:hypothetical protein
LSDLSESIEVSDIPELSRLAEDVQRRNKPLILQRDGKELAVIVPLPIAPTQVETERTEADREAFLAAAGSWRGLVDTDKLIEDIYESRRRSSRPPVDL